MFVLATMTAATFSGPIKIRNMSPGGALIEGNALPRIGEQVCLRRGDLAVAGRVVWREAGKAGLRFDDDVQVTTWLPAGSGKQQQVDRAFDELKAAPSGPLRSATSQIQRTRITARELLDLASALDALADDLAGDAAVVANQASKLQTLDIASQVLRKIGTSAAKGASSELHEPNASAAPAARHY